MIVSINYPPWFWSSGAVQRKTGQFPQMEARGVMRMKGDMNA